MAEKTTNILNTAANLPKKITDVTDSISKGATKVHDMTTRMDTALRGVPTYNPVSGAIKGGLTKVSGAIDTKAASAESAANKLNIAGNTVATAISPVATAAKTVNQAVTDLQNCQQVIDAASVLVDAIVNSVSGHFHPRDLGTAFQNFDDKWDSWARVVNKAYEKLSPSGQTNVLMDLANNNFSPSVVALGSAIKNESAGIFNGIADFESSIHAFRGSYRDPVQAAKKIETGVKGIINATEKVANSINNMIKTYQKGVGATVTGNPVLSYIGNLHNTPAVSALNKVLTAGGGAATLWSDASSLTQALKSKDLKTIYKSAEKTVKDASTIIKGLKDSDAATKTTTLAQNTMASSKQSAKSNLTSSSGSKQSASNNGSSGSQQKNQKKDLGGGGASTDSYVCSGATMKCSMGTSQAKLTVLPIRTVYLTGQPMANISDHLTMVNLAPFGRCRSLGFPATASATAANHGSLTPMPCMHNTPFPWMGGKNDYIVKGDPALLKSSTCQCMWGGTISITDDGQHGEGTQWVSKSQQDEFDKEQESTEGVDANAVLDGIQVALDVAGFVPGFGAIPDLTNAAISALRGNWSEAGLSVLAAVPIVGDAAAGAKLASRGMKIAKDVNKARKVVLAKEAKNYISKEITKKELLKSGICQSEKEVEFFQKALRGERKKFATEFYHKSGITEKGKIVSHVNGIDLNHAVKVKKMPPPNELIRFNEPGMEKGGSYFGVSTRTGDKINTPRSYGIQPVVVKRGEGFVTVVRKKKTVYKIADEAQPFEYLESTARPIKAPLDNNWNSAKNVDSGIRNAKTGKIRENWTDTKGGATQAFIPFKYRGCIIP